MPNPSASLRGAIERTLYWLAKGVLEKGMAIPCTCGAKEGVPCFNQNSCLCRYRIKMGVQGVMNGGIPLSD